MLERMWIKRKTSSLLMGVQILLPLWKSVWWLVRKLGISLPQDQAISLLGIYANDIQPYYKDICSTMFITALFIMFIAQKQSR